MLTVGRSHEHVEAACQDKLVTLVRLKRRDLRLRVVHPDGNSQESLYRFRMASTIPW